MKEKLKQQIESMLKSKQHLLPIMEKDAACDKPAKKWSFKWDLEDVKKCKEDIIFLKKLLKNF